MLTQKINTLLYSINKITNKNIEYIHVQQKSRILIENNFNIIVRPKNK